MLLVVANECHRCRFKSASVGMGLVSGLRRQRLARLVRNGLIGGRFDMMVLWRRYYADGFLLVAVMMVVMAAAEGCEEDAQKSKCQIFHGFFLLFAITCRFRVSYRGSSLNR